MGTVHRGARIPRLVSTVSAFAHDLDAGRYRCPGPLDRAAARLLDTDGRLLVLAVTGRGGVGKSAALREVARRAVGMGWTVVLLGGRRPDAIEAIDALAGLPAGPTLVVVDDAEHLGAGLNALGRAIEDLPATTRVVVAGRRLPARWLPDHLVSLAGHHRLGMLGRRDADRLLLRYDVSDEVARRAIVDWAGGLPLALVLGAAEALVGEPGSSLATSLARTADDDLVAHLAGTALDQVDPDLVELAAVAGGVDRRLLADVLPTADPQSSLAVLRSLSIVEESPGRLVLDPRVAEVVTARMRAADPCRAQELTLRIAGHLHDRAAAGDRPALVWLAGLVADPALRAGLDSAVGVEHYADRARPADGAAVRAVLEHARPGAWPHVEPWLATDLAYVVRDADAAPVALVVVLPLAWADALPPGCLRLVDPVVAHARAAGLTDRAVLTPVQLVLVDDPDPEVVRIRNAVALQRCSVVNPRRDLVIELVDPRAADREAAVLVAFGYHEIPELARPGSGSVDGEATPAVRVWAADVGRGGLAGLLYEAVAAEQGRPLRAGGEVGATLLETLESFHNDTVLAGLSVVPVGPPHEAADRLRTWARDHVDQALAEEPALLDLVVRRYIEPGASHASVIRDTYLSRATYFRRLRRARDLLSEG